MKSVVIKRDGCRAPFDAALIAEAVTRAAEAVNKAAELVGLAGLDLALAPMVISVGSRGATCPFNYVGTIKDLETAPCMKGPPPYLFSLAKLLEVSCRQVRPP